jgi:tetratricopeptide (TPR) repeat protein
MRDRDVAQFSSRHHIEPDLLGVCGKHHNTKPTKNMVVRRNRAVSASTGAAPTSCLVSQYVDTVIDAYYDGYAGVVVEALRPRLAQARRFVTSALDASSALNESQHATLLAKLANVLRVQAITQHSFDDSLQTLDRARRTVEKALTIHPNNVGARLEAANCYWNLARHALTDADYVQLLSQSEEQYKAITATARYEIADLSLAKFYRLTYQASKACDTYQAVRSYASNRRLLLREAHVLAESVQNLWYHDWYHDYPESYLSPLVSAAIRNTQAAMDSGYRYARHIVNLAVLYAMSGDLIGSQTVLSSELSAKGGYFDWNSLARVVSDDFLAASADDVAKSGLALGLNDPMVLNRLGTYMLDFQNNTELALAFYNAAEKASPKNAIILTNKARLLIGLGERSRLDEIDRLLQRASGYADRRFTWWRHYMNIITEWRGKSPRPRRISRKVEPETSFLSRRVAFHQIEAISDRNQRGLEFERFVVAIIGVSFTEYRGSHRSPGAQNDAFFVHRDRPFRVEVKWESVPVEPRVLREFFGRLGPVGLNGLFISMSGFGEEAVAVAKQRMTERCILLIDGDELRRVVEGEMSFLELVDFKFLSFYQLEDPYRKMAVSKRKI